MKSCDGLSKPATSQNQKLPKSLIAKELYQSVDSKAVVKILWNSISTSITKYKDSSLPLTLKVALPATLAGAAIFGAQGAGLAAFGGAVGLPIVLIIFLGTAGLTSIIEAFIKDEKIRDPLTISLLAIAALDAQRKYKKEFLQTLKKEMTTAQKVNTPSEDKDLILFLRTMDPIAFERHVMSFFNRDGYPVGITPRSNDYGVDGWVKHPNGLIIVQCKRYAESNKVSRPEVQQFKGVIEEQNALKGYFVTTSYFTEGAKESASQSRKIILVDIEQLVAWHKKIKCNCLDLTKP